MADVDIDSGQLSPELKAQAVAMLRDLKNKPTEDSAVDDDDPSSDIRADGADGTSGKAKAKPDADEELEEKVAPKKKADTKLSAEQELKLRVRQEAQRYRAAAQKDAADAARERQEVALEKQRVAVQQAEYERKVAELEAKAKFAKEKPEEYLTEVGRPLDDIVRDKLEDGRPDARATQALREIEVLKREMQKDRDTLRAEREANTKASEESKKASEQKAIYDQQIAQEQSYIKMALGGEYPELSWFAKEEPQDAIAMGYIAHSKFKQERGREPSMEELVATVEAKLAKRSAKTEDEKPKNGKRKGAVTPGTSVASAPQNLEDVSDDDRVKLAKKHLAKMRREEKQEESE